MTRGYAYPGESESHRQARLLAADQERERAEQERADAEREEARRQRAASGPTRPAQAAPAPAATSASTPTPQRVSRPWAHHGGDHPTDFYLTPEAS